MLRRTLGLIAGVGIAAMGCKDSTSVGDLNNVSSQAIAGVGIAAMGCKDSTSVTDLNNV